MGFQIEERECVIVYDAYTKKTKVYTNDSKCMTKFKKANWKITKETKEDDRVIALEFESWGFPISVRDVSKPKVVRNRNGFFAKSVE